MVSVHTAHKIHKSRRKAQYRRKGSSISKKNPITIFHKDKLPATIGMLGMLIAFSLFSLQMAMAPFVPRQNRQLEVFQQEAISYDYDADQQPLDGYVVPCPQFMPPADGWCDDGIIVPERDENDCAIPRCITHGLQIIAPYNGQTVAPGQQFVPITWEFGWNNQLNSEDIVSVLVLAQLDEQGGETHIKTLAEDSSPGGRRTYGDLTTIGKNTFNWNIDPNREPGLYQLQIGVTLRGQDYYETKKVDVVVADPQNQIATYDLDGNGQLDNEDYYLFVKYYGNQDKRIDFYTQDQVGDRKKINVLDYNVFKKAIEAYSGDVIEPPI